MAWECYRHRAAIVDFAEGELDEPARTSVERHLAACPTCSAAVLELREVPAEIRRRLAQQPEPGEDFWKQQRESILRAVERAKPPTPARRTRMPSVARSFRLGGYAAAAAAVLILVRTWSSPTLATHVANTSAPRAEVTTATEDSSTTSAEEVAAIDLWNVEDGSLLSLADELGGETADASDEELI